MSRPIGSAVVHIRRQPARHVIETPTGVGANIEAIRGAVIPVRYVRVVFGAAPPVVDMTLAAAKPGRAPDQRQLPGEFAYAVAKCAQAVAPAVGGAITAAVAATMTGAVAIAVAIAIAAAWVILVIVTIVLGGRRAVSARMPVVGRVMMNWPTGRKASCFLWCALTIHT